MIDKEQTGRKISILRKKLGYSQASLAEKLGVTTQAVSKWETGLALPDMDILLELSWIFEISINNLLEGYETFTNSSIISRAKLPENIDKLHLEKGEKRFLASLVPYFTENELYDLAKQIIKDDIQVKVSISAYSKENKTSKSCSIPIISLQDNSLRELAPAVSECINNLIGNVDPGLKRISDFLMCPQCKKKLILNAETELSKLFYECEDGHKYNIEDGVIYFNTREIPGDEWSLNFRNYEHYLEWKKPVRKVNYMRGQISTFDKMWCEIEKNRPHIILDIASGMGGGVGDYVNKINWPCIIIMTDLSHRILKYDNKYFSEELKNPYVDIVYLACDCANLPINDNTIDMVTSNCGFESMNGKFMNGFKEAYRILKQNGQAVYNMLIVDDHSSYNTQKWIELLEKTYPGFEFAYNDISMWLDICKNTGYKNTKSYKIFGELPVPDTDTFPYESGILLWMGEYIISSEK